MELINFLSSIFAALKVAKDGRYYLVVAGKARFIRKGVLVDTGPTKPVRVYTTQVITFTKVHPLLGDVRVITNTPMPEEFASYQASVDTKMPVNDIFALNSGAWAPQLLIERLGNKGIPFRLVVASNGCINPMDQENQAQFIQDWTNLVNKVDFAWANASYTFLMQVGETRKWGLDLMGIDLVDAPKSSKRSNEIVRTTMLWWYSEDPAEIDKIRIKVVAPVDLSPTQRDGMSYVSKSFALRLTDTISDPEQRAKMVRGIMSGRIKRLNARVLFPAGVVNGYNGGLIKGDMIIRPNKFMGKWHIITVPENIKTEIKPTDKWFSFSASEHHPTYEATWDIQRLVMNPQILTHEHRQRDIDRYVKGILDAVNQGELPEWVLLGSNDAHDNEGESMRESYKDHDLVAYRWQAAGFDIRAAQNVLRMAMGSVTNRMAKHYDGLYQGKVKGYAKALPLRKSNAFVGLIVTHGSLTKVGNYQTTRKGDKVWFAPGIGIIIPDQRFEEIYALMGGADFDDSAEQNLVKIWSSDPNITEMMRKNGVIGAHEVIPTTKDEAVYRSANLRSPNGVGEYSFLEYEDILDLPWQDLDIENVEVIDLADLPLPQGEALKKIKVTPVQGSHAHTKTSWTRKDALRQILAQQYNPGIGGVANTIMAWSNVAGPSFPPSMTAPFEQLVDGAQQLSDPVIFAMIKKLAKDASTDAINALQRGKTVDSYLIRRFSGPKHQQIAAQHAVDGPLTEFEKNFQKAIETIYLKVEQKSLQMRAQQPIIRWVNSLNFSGDAQKWAKEFHDLWSGKLEMVDRKYTGLIKNSGGLKRIALQRTKSAEMRQVIDGVVEAINTFDKPGQRVLCLWQYMVKPVPGTARTYGGYDRLMFQQGNGTSLMDILIPVLHSRDWGSEIPEEDIPFLAAMEDPDEEDISVENFGLDPEEYDQFLQICALMQDED